MKTNPSNHKIFCCGCQRCLCKATSQLNSQEPPFSSLWFLDMMEGEDPEVGNRSGKEGGSHNGCEVGEGEK